MTEDELSRRCIEYGITVSVAGFVREAAAVRLLDVPVRTLRQWRMDGVGPRAVRFVGTWRYSLAALAEFVTGEMRQNPAEPTLKNERPAREGGAHENHDPERGRGTAYVPRKMPARSARQRRSRSGAR